MTKNPFYNAFLAIAYIALVVTAITSTSFFLKDTKDNVLMPVVMLSLLVLSVAIMAYLFFYQPVIMLIDGEREKAAKLLLSTIGIFAAGTAVIAIVSFALAKWPVF